MGKITVGKIVANATDTGWSQAYHAGGFTAVISLTQEGSTDEKEKTLQEHGKKLLDTLVSEYFTLTTKDLATVKGAVETTMEKAPKDMHASLLVAAVVKNVLYVVVAHEGRVLLKRGDKLGLLLEVKPDEEEKVASVSGFLEAGDIVLLHTSGFGKIFTHDDLVAAFENRTTDELSEYLAPKVHETQNGAASALVFSYHDDEAPLPQSLPETKEEAVEEEEKPVAKDLPGFEKPLDTKPKVSFSHKQKLFLSITVILGLVLLGSVLLFQNRQQQAKQQALFQSVYQPAKTKYDEATGLMDLNKALAIEDLQDAQNQLMGAKSKFPTSSSEEKQITALLSLVTKALETAKKVPLLSADKAPDNASPLLSFAAKHDNTYVAQDDTNFYTADNTAVTQYSKKTADTGKKVITADWKAIGGYAPYFGNVYVADTKDGILKYVGGSSGFGSKQTYFASGVSPDLSKAVSIAIDGSIWVLTSDGTISKYTKGTQDSFSVSGLDNPLKNPTQIMTTVDLDNVYILDKGNSRVVVLKKDGSFVAQYGSDTVRTTTMIDVSEKNKKLYLLSNGTVYQLDLK